MTTNPRFEPIGVQTHDLQIMDSTLNVPEMLVLYTYSHQGPQVYPHTALKSTVRQHCTKRQVTNDSFQGLLGLWPQKIKAPKTPNTITIVIFHFT